MTDLLESDFSYEFTKVKMELIDLDKEFHEDMILGRGFLIKEKSLIKKEKTEYGIYSPKYATDWDDDFSFAERYSCKCKHLKGMKYEGQVCPECRHEVKFVDVDMKITGWVSLKNACYIHPTVYKKLEAFIGAGVLNEILVPSGDITYKPIPKYASPFSRIGVEEFKERYSEILVYFYKKKKDKKDLFEELYANKHLTFPKNFPIFSSVMRPTSIKADEFKYVPINKTFEIIVNTSLKLNNIKELKSKKSKKGKTAKTLDKEVLVKRFQDKVNKSWDEIFNMLDGKRGHIKDNILGGRIDFTARNVIVPDPSLKADEIKVCYKTFLELFKLEIIALLVQTNDITEAEAFKQWSNATIIFDEYIYQLSAYIIEKHKPRILINRPPTINFGSYLCMKVVAVKRQMNDDYTMNLPLRILPVLNADFDGDNLTMVSVKIKSIMKKFDKVYNPRKGFYISRNDGLFNSDFNLFKDQLIGLYRFNTI